MKSQTVGPTAVSGQQKPAALLTEAPRPPHTRKRLLPAGAPAGKRCCPRRQQYHHRPAACVTTASGKAARSSGSDASVQEGLRAQPSAGKSQARAVPVVFQTEAAL